MTLGHSTNALTDLHKVSKSRISQMRREFLEDWLRFTGELPKPMQRPKVGLA
jgi:hypothetical protein